MHSQIRLFLACAALMSAACGSSDKPTTPEPSGKEITWHQDIAPLVTAKCVGCHNDKGIAPFSMERYEDVVAWAGAMVTQTASGAMPPFLAEDTDECVPRYTWKDDLRLSEPQKALIKAWAHAGAPEGDAATAAELPPPVELTLKSPDMHLAIPTPVDIDGNRDQFWCFVIETKLDHDQWFSAMQINAGNAKVVHHVLVFNDVNNAVDAKRAADGKYECFGGVGVSGASLVSAWAPGGIPFRTPKDVAFQFKAKSRLILQVHYHPTGEKQTDTATGIDLQFASGTPKYSTAVRLIGNFVSPVLVGGLLPGPDDPPGVVEFKIPAGVKKHTESMTSLVNGANDLLIWSMGTHMHYVGRSMSVHLKRAAPKDGEPEQECLIHTPAWNFNWQRGYAYDTPLDQVPVARSGDKFLFQCEYDNSMENPFVANALKQQGLSAPRDVYMGETTLDEMCLGAFGIATKIDPAAP
jgi:hypothetical protein